MLRNIILNHIMLQHSILQHIVHLYEITVYYFIAMHTKVFQHDLETDRPQDDRTASQGSTVGS